MTDTPIAQLPYFYIQCEMQDVADSPQLPMQSSRDLPASAPLELAKLLHSCELAISDDDRAPLIELGGWMLQLHSLLEGDRATGAVA